MDTSSDKTAGSEREASIRLRYSRQFQSGGHAHTIDAETILPVGAGQERREQVLHELEAGVEQLARQIIQRAARPGGETRPQTATRPATLSSPAARTAEPVRFQNEPNAAAQRQAMNAPAPVPQTPVSENMPASPASSGEGNTVRLPQFINAIKKRWDMSLKEAMDLLHVTTLEGANLREVYAQLQAIVESRNANPPRTNPPARTTQPAPVVEAPRQINRGTQSQQPPTSRFPANQATTAAETRSQGQAAFKDVARPVPPTKPIPEPAAADKQPHERRQDFGGSSKAPIPIQIGVVRDISPQAYKFEEEEEGEEAFELSEDENPDRIGAQLKLDELRGIRGSAAASAGRLTVLNNVVDSQISEEQLLKIIQAVWDVNTKKKLKMDQVEALISWAKEDSFVEGAEAVLALIEEGEG